MDNQNVTLDEVRTWPATVDVRDAVRALGISWTHGYRLAREGRFPCQVVRMGKRRVKVVTSSLIRLLDETAP
ncbi:DNA-binding protein [Amycolatopsis sp. NPDC058340]|uniref:DNA-binding protein n=1 Tax=Amycolatopsis sp. NPDC058340 TaxID=3346453 RepID=UPI0036691CB8